MIQWRRTEMKKAGSENGETWVLKTWVPPGFLSTSSTTSYKSRLKNSIFILELEKLVSNIVLQRNN